MTTTTGCCSFPVYQCVMAWTIQMEDIPDKVITKEEKHREFAD
jgi:hypothetical protein